MRFATAFKPLFIAGLMLLAVAVQPSARAAPASNPRWKFDLVDSAGDVGKFASLALQPGTGMPAVGYHDGTNTHPSVARHVGAGGNCGPGNSWQCEALGLGRK
jgi:hypothetical protein